MPFVHLHHWLYLPLIYFSIFKLKFQKYGRLKWRPQHKWETSLSITPRVAQPLEQSQFKQHCGNQLLASSLWPVLTECWFICSSGRFGHLLLFTSLKCLFCVLYLACPKIIFFIFSLRVHFIDQIRGRHPHSLGKNHIPSHRWFLSSSKSQTCDVRCRICRTSIPECGRCQPCCETHWSCLHSKFSSLAVVILMMITLL